MYFYVFILVLREDKFFFFILIEDDRFIIWMSWIKEVFKFGILICKSVELMF